MGRRTEPWQWGWRESKDVIRPSAVTGVGGVQCLSDGALKSAFVPSDSPTSSTRSTWGVLLKCRFPGASSSIMCQNLWGWNPRVLICTSICESLAQREIKTSW